MTKLNRANLPSLKSGIAVPAYQASDLKPGILHFGLGNFHRAHQAVYLDALFNMGRSRDWGIIGTGVRSADRAMHDALKPQDWLTTVVEQEANVSRARVTGAMLGMIPPEDRAAIVRQLAIGGGGGEVVAGPEAGAVGRGHREAVTGIEVHGVGRAHGDQVVGERH